MKETTETGKVLLVEQIDGNYTVEAPGEWQSHVTVSCVIRKNGKDTQAVAYCQYAMHDRTDVFDLHGTNFWARVYTGETPIRVEMKDWSDKAIVWMKSNYSTYYYDRKGVPFCVDVLDDEGEDLPDSVATCRTCGHTFRVSSHFLNGNCGACAEYSAEEAVDALAGGVAL